jgi:hypothetical protein
MRVAIVYSPCALGPGLEGGDGAILFDDVRSLGTSAAVSSEA